VLDVSSPGMDNPLKVPRQYKKRIGRTLHIVKTDGTEIEAELIAADDEKIKLREIAKPEKKKKKGVKAEAMKPLAFGEGLGRGAKEFELKYAEIKKAIIQIDWSKIKGKAADIEGPEEDTDMDESRQQEDEQ
jgi:ribosome maturation factor RimP